jgi:putative membrane protein
MHHPVHSAEATLAERFAQGDIDEKDYRARLEVLRANSPHSA